MAKKKSDKLLIPVMLIIFFAFLSFMFLTYMENSNIATGFFGKEVADVESPDPVKVATYSDTVFIIGFIIILVILLEYRRRKRRK